MEEKGYSDIDEKDKTKTEGSKIQEEAMSEVSLR